MRRKFLMLLMLGGCTLPQNKDTNVVTTVISTPPSTMVTPPNTTVKPVTKPIVKSPPAVVPTSPVEQSTTVPVPKDPPGAPIALSLAHDNIVYIWDAVADAFYYVVNGEKKYMPKGWHK